MAPPTAPARALPPRPEARPDPSGPRRPPLRIFEPGKRKERSRRAGRSTLSVRRSTMWFSAVLVVGSLLAVVVGDALVSEGQVRLAAAQQELQAATNTRNNYQVNVALKSAPDRVVSEAEHDGYSAPPNVVDLPFVPLNVPLPVPNTSPTAGQ